MSFRFSEENRAKISMLKSRILNDRALVLPALWMVQRAKGFIDKDDAKYLSEELNLPLIYFIEAISFFAMLNGAKKGKFELKFCRTLSCKLRGSEELVKTAQKILGIKMGQTTSDGLFTLGEAECLGYCEKAPCMLVNLDQFDELNDEKLAALIAKLRSEA